MNLPQITFDQQSSRTRGLRLQTLVWLRWIAVVGQTAAVLFIYLVLGFPLPLGFCLAVIALSAWLNIFLALRWRSTLRLSDHATALLMGYDIVQLAALLYLTGGLENPFAFLFLVPVMVSATTLSPRHTIWLAALALSLSTLLTAVHLPLPWKAGETLVVPPLYVAGLWTALLCGTVFSAVYASRIAAEARQMSEALAATEMVLAREQQLSALDGLAAAAAHELGTPLATIALVAKELKRDFPDSGQYTEDLDLLLSQADRCREILSRLSDREAQTDAMFARLKLTVMREEIADPLRGSGIAILVKSNPADATASPEPWVLRNPAVNYGIGNLLENAVDFAATRVDVEARWSDAEVSILISDDGPGFSQDIIDRLGDPFVTTRKGYDAADASADLSKHQGMGLGFFIAKTLLERSGAVVTLANRKDGGRGAMVTIAWPRPAVEASSLTPPLGEPRAVAGNN
jgi:two-component system, sensor histidine kinase RegB